MDNSSSMEDSSPCWPQDCQAGEAGEILTFLREESRMQMFLPLRKALSSAPFPSSCAGCRETFPAGPAPLCKALYEPVAEHRLPQHLCCQGNADFCARSPILNKKLEERVNLAEPQLTLASLSSMFPASLPSGDWARRQGLGWHLGCLTHQGTFKLNDKTGIKKGIMTCSSAVQ